MNKMIVSALLLAILLTACNSAAEKETVPVTSEITKQAEQTEENVGEQDIQSEEQNPPEVSSGIPVIKNHFQTDDLTDEDGKLLVRWTVNLPYFHDLNNEAETVINVYYENLMTKAKNLAEAGLYPRALEDYQTDPGGFSAYQLTESYEISYYDGGVVSIPRTIVIEHGGETETLMYAETFNLENGGLLIFDDFFTVSQEEAQARILEEVDARIQSGGIFFESASEYAKNSFDKNNFYLTEDAFVIFYPEGTLADASYGPVKFEIPFDAQGGIFAFPNK